MFFHVFFPRDLHNIFCLFPLNKSLITVENSRKIPHLEKSPRFALKSVQIPSTGIPVHPKSFSCTSTAGREKSACSAAIDPVSPRIVSTNPSEFLPPTCKCAHLCCGSQARRVVNMSLLTANIPSQPLNEILRPPAVETRNSIQAIIKASSTYVVIFVRRVESFGFLIARVVVEGDAVARRVEVTEHRLT